MGRPSYVKPETLTQRGYARHRGVSHKSVQKAIAAGRITTVAGDRIDPRVADSEWAANTDVTKPRNSVSGDPKHRRREDGAPSPARSRASRGDESQAGAESDLRSADRGYTAARAMREAYAAKTARLEYERLSGKLIDSDEVRRDGFETGRRVRDSVLSIPDRISPILAGLTDVDEIHRTLSKELREALEGLSHGQRA
jgi:hypothetical protein